MKYLNAADVLPPELFQEVSHYVNGQLLYVLLRNVKNHGEVKAVPGQYYEQRIIV